MIGTDGGRAGLKGRGWEDRTRNWKERKGAYITLFETESHPRGKQHGC